MGYRKWVRVPRVSGGFCILLALGVLLLPLQWLLAAGAAAVFHELCHYCAIVLLSREGGSVGFYSFGARLPLPTMSRGRELLCALAGPFGGLILLLFAKYIPRIALCGAFQSIFNLLPVYPMDGGRALQCFLQLCLPPPKAEKAALCTERICLSGILALGIWGTVIKNLGLFPLSMAAVTILRVKFSKIPCKVGSLRVQ